MQSESFLDYQLIGFDFKPWQAVGIFKNVGNFAVFLGSALALTSVGLDIYSTHEEREQEQKIADARRDITSQFQSMAVDLKRQIEAQHRSSRRATAVARCKLCYGYYFTNELNQY